MGDVLGLGVTHGPFVMYPPEILPNLTRKALERPGLPPEMRDPQNWPEPMQKEWGDDEGVAGANEYHRRIVEGFRRARKALDEFNPDVVLIWGDDQYENFLEDVLPAFCVFIEDEWQTKPFGQRNSPGSTQNIYNEDPDWTLKVNGHRPAAKELATYLLNQEFDIAYAYKQLHHPIGHAFWRTVMHLDVDRIGFPYPVILFHVNCIGTDYFRNRGGGLGRDGTAEPDPPGPSPARCFELGAAVGRFFKQSPYSAALVGSSSWSHGFLTRKNHQLWPDIESDRARLEELARGDYMAWKSLTTSQIEDAGQHEILNWICLAGAMHEMGCKTTHSELIETWICGATSTMAICSMP